MVCLCVGKSAIEVSGKIVEYEVIDTSASCEYRERDDLRCISSEE